MREDGSGRIDSPAATPPERGKGLLHLSGTGLKWLTGSNRGPAIVVLVVLAGGALLAGWAAQRSDLRMRDDLLQQARLVAKGVDLDSLAALSGTAADLSAPEYLRLKEHLALARQVVPECRFLYLTGRREDGSIFFFADSEPIGSEDESAAGQGYDEAPDLLRDLFSTAHPAVGGPLDDRLGTWVSAFVPLVDPHTDRVVAVFGIDVGTGGWRARIIGRLVAPIAFTAALTLIVLGGVGLLRRRERESTRRRPESRLTRRAEAAITAAAGLTLTFFLAYEAGDLQNLLKQNTFRSLASARASLVADALRDVGDQQLEGLALFFQASEHMDRREFQTYTGLLSRNPDVRSWGWAPVVRAAERTTFEEDARLDGAPEFTVWEWDAQGHRVPAGERQIHYPVLYAAPLESDKVALGYDLGSHPRLRAALNEAARTGLATATNPITLAEETGSHSRFVVFRRVSAADDPNRVEGFVAAVPRLGAMLRAPLGQAAREVPEVTLHLYQLRSDAIPEILAGEPTAPSTGPHAAEGLRHYRDKAFTLVHPIHVFGKTYAVVARPGPTFHVLYPARTGWLTVLYGSLLTALLAVLVGYLANRRLVLEQRVAERTAELQASEARLSETLRSIGDGVIVANRTGLITRMNPVAESLTGWCEAEALGKPLGEVFSILHEETREAVRNPVETALGEGMMTGLAEHTLLLARDGTERMIAGNGAPIRDARGRMAGVVLVFRDRTEERAAREALRESEERYRQLFLSNPHPMWVYDLETLDFLAVNDAAVSHYGYSREEFLGMTIADIRPPEDVPRLWRSVNAVSEGIDFAGEWRHIKKDKSLILVEIACHTLEWRGRRAELVLATDVTDRRRTEDQLRLHAMVLDQISDHVTVTDLLGKITYVNQAQVKSLGYSHDRLIGQTTEAQGEDSEYGTTQKEILQRTLRNGEWRGDIVNYSSDGRRLIMDCRTQVVRDRHGTPIAICGVGTDITERRRAEEEGRKLSQALEQSPALVLITDLQGSIEYVNPKFTEVTGYTLDEVRGRNPSILKSGETSPEVYRELWETIRSGGEWHGELRNRKKDGTLFWERAVIAPIRDPRGRFTHFLAVKEDITAQKALEAQFLQAQKMETVGRLAGGVAHDFNNMLTVILGLGQMILDRLDPANELRADLEEVLEAARRSAELTRQLLGFARKQTTSPRVLDLNDTVASLLRMLRRLIGEEIQLAWRPGRHLWPVRADPAQIDQILANLSVNARDAIAGGGNLTIETENVVFDEAYCEAHAGSVPGEYVLLTVSDDGCGMDREILDHAFEPFFTTKETGKGTGLGLATVYGIVKQNGGFITIYSEPGWGTSVNVYLPRSRAAGETSSAPGARREPAGGDETVLLVDDEEAILRIGRKVLERFGYHVLAARSRDEALALVDGHVGPIHLLLTDVVMPETTGRELWESIEALRPAIKLLFMSGHSADIIGRQGMIEEGVQFLQKPFSIRTLAAKVREVLDH